MLLYDQVQDSFPFPIALSWKGPAPETEGEEEASPNSIVFVRGNPVPSTKMLTFYRSGTFSIDAFYAETNDLPVDTNPKISTFTVRHDFTIYSVIRKDSPSLCSEKSDSRAFIVDISCYYYGSLSTNICYFCRPGV